jgi:anthranilate synthase component II
LKILILDNYDSFTFNLVHLIEKVSHIPFEVYRNDAISLEKINEFDKIVLSPGPGLPKDAGIMPELLKHYSSSKSILGVCLGMQAIAEHYGASLKNLDTVCHGQATSIQIIKKDVLFKNCPTVFNVGRYHSWVVNNNELPNELEVLAVDEQQNMMALKHKHHAVSAVQFHPESILSEYGETIIKNWIETNV